MCKTLAPVRFVLKETRLGSFRSAPAAARPLRRRHLYRRICGVRLRSNDGERAVHHLSDAKESIRRDVCMGCFDVTLGSNIFRHWLIFLFIFIEFGV